MVSVDDQVHVYVLLVSRGRTARISVRLGVLVKTVHSSVNVKTRLFAAPRLVNVFALLAGREIVAIDHVKKGGMARTVHWSVIVTTMVHVMPKLEIALVELAGLAKSVTANVTLAISGITARKHVNAIQTIRSLVMQ